MTDNEERISLIELDLPTSAPAPASRRQAIPAARATAPATASSPAPAPTSAPAPQNAATGTAAPVSRTSGREMLPASDPSAPAVVRAIDAAVQTSREQMQGRTRGAAVRQAIPATQTGGAGRAPEGELRAGNIVAGAVAAGNGALMGWTGSGRMTRAAIVSSLNVAGMPAAWAPSSKSAHAYAGQAVKLLDSQGLVTRAERTRALPAGPARPYRARWIVGAVGSAVENATANAFGRRVLVVTLGAADALAFEGDQQLAARVQESYETQRNGETFEAGEVTAWLRSVLVGRFRAVRLGGVWYVPAKYKADAEKLCDAVSRAGWGQDWMLPALPVATSEQMLTGIRNGIVEEIAAVERELREARDERQKKGEPEITSRLAARLLVDVGTVAERLSHYSVLLGERHTAPVRARVESLRMSLEPLADGSVQRFEQIGEEMGWREGL